MTPDTRERERETGKRRRAKRPEAHVFMSQEDRSALEEWAQQECRSLNGQVLHIIRTALATRRHSIVGLAPQSPADRVRDATRRAAKGA